MFFVKRVFDLTQLDTMKYSTVLVLCQTSFDLTQLDTMKYSTVLVLCQM